eukprot:31191-Pelagococcus_subviridis.AAC.23
MREGVFRDGGRATTTRRAEDGGGFARVARWGRTLIFTIFVDGTSRRGASVCSRGSARARVRRATRASRLGKRSVDGRRVVAGGEALRRVERETRDLTRFDERRARDLSPPRVVGGTPRRATTPAASSGDAAPAPGSFHGSTRRVHPASARRRRLHPERSAAFPRRSSTRHSHHVG